MDSPSKCSYCQLIIDSDDFLNCGKCKGSIHTKCLLRPGTPGDLQGDVFFTFSCIKCSTTSKEVFNRKDLSWFMVVILSLYNLSVRSSGLSRQGYFHYRTHICNFIAKNWTFLFEPSHTIYRQRKKKWQGTVAGILSANKNYFVSGYDVFGEAGWWKLAYNQSPKFYYKLYEQMSRLQLRNDKKNVEESCSSDPSSTLSEDCVNKRRKKEDRIEEPTVVKVIGIETGTLRKRKEEKEDKDDLLSCARIRPYLDRKTEDVEIKVEISEEPKDMNFIQSQLMDFLAENLSTDYQLPTDLSIDSNEMLPFVPPYQDNNTLDFWNTDSTNLGYENVHLGSPLELATNESLNDDEDNYKPRIVQVTNFQKSEHCANLNYNNKSTRIKQEVVSEDEEQDVEAAKEECGKSLFTKKPKREAPWKEDDSEGTSLSQIVNQTDDFDSGLKMMSEYEEKAMHQQLKEILSVEKSCNLEIPPFIRRLYRKLCVRNIKRNASKKLFNLDTFGENRFVDNQKSEILDRYYQVLSDTKMREGNGFQVRITGSAHDELFESPYTSRILHPYIYRHSKCFPPWLKLLCEMQYTVNGVPPTRSTVDFCYVRPHHLAAVNGLLQKLFWPGIDMSECLSYPDFSVVALYKKVVIGCAFLVPDVGYNEAYISFLAVRPGWQRSGIASFMLYHLTQTCMGKDITLHVSATNPAICLYQKFGFKIEQVILDFYEKYLPIESTHSRHACFLRLKR